MTTGRIATTASLTPSRLSAFLIAATRVGVALMWIDNVSWKIPPNFGEGDPPRMLYRWTLQGVEHEVFAPWSRFVETAVLPNFALFGWFVLAAEASLGAFLLIGLFTRFWALVGIAQTGAITLSALNAPHEWHWSFLLMFLVHIALFATERLDYTAARAGLLIATVGLTGALARVVWAAAAERRGGPVASLRVLPLIGVTALASILLSTYLARWLVWPGAALAGLSVLTFTALGMLAVVDVVPYDRVGTASGSLSRAFFGGLLVGPAAFGAVVDVTGSYTWGWAMVLALLSAATLVSHLALPLSNGARQSS
jgi:thiosulfate dehydrogenase (quinone) large subunit